MGGTGRPNPHAYDPEPQVGVRGILADPNAPAGGIGRGQSRDARPRDPDSWWSLGHWTLRAEEIVGSVVHKGEQFVHDAEDEIHRVREVYEAVMLATSYAPATVKAQIGVDVEELMRAFIPGLLMMFVILAATTLLGATIGAAIGALAGGVGALPGAVVGGDLGLDAGFVVLDAMGIGFLLAGMASELPKIFEHIRGGLNAAWNAGHDPRVPASKDIERAGHMFAEAIAEFMELLVQGLLAYLLRDGLAGKVGKISSKLDKLDATEAVAARSRELIQALKQSPGEVREALKARLGQLEAELRKAGRWVEGLVQWLEKHLDNLIDNFEKRHPRPVFEGAGGGDAAGGPSGGSTGAGSTGPGGKRSLAETPQARRNARLAGGQHPKTGVPFNEKGYPMFDSAFDVDLPQNLQGPDVSDDAQFKFATNQLKQEIADNPAMAQQFTSEQLEAINQDSPKIPDYTWHHSENVVTLQLVDQQTHALTGHDGGRALTGGRP